MSIAYISEYRKFTFSLCQELSTEDLNSLKYLLRDLLTIREIEAANSPTDLFVFLEQRNMLGSDNSMHLLKDLLTQMKRKDLVRKLQDFERKQLGEPAIVAINKAARNGIRRAVNMEGIQDCVADGEQTSLVPGNNNAYVQRGKLSFIPSLRKHTLRYCRNILLIF